MVSSLRRPAARGLKGALFVVGFLLLLLYVCVYVRLLCVRMMLCARAACGVRACLRVCVCVCVCVCVHCVCVCASMCIWLCASDVCEVVCACVFAFFYRQITYGFCVRLSTIRLLGSPARRPIGSLEDRRTEPVHGKCCPASFEDRGLDASGELCVASVPKAQTLGRSRNIPCWFQSSEVKVAVVVDVVAVC